MALGSDAAHEGLAADGKVDSRNNMYSWILEERDPGLEILSSYTHRLQSKKPFRFQFYHLPGDSYVVPFWVVYFTGPIIHKQIITKDGTTWESPASMDGYLDFLELGIQPANVREPGRT